MSTMPVAMAARGMPSYFAVSGFCANVIPPAALISRTPVAPSDAVPDKITPMARLWACSASEVRNESIGVYCVRSSGRGLKSK